MVASAGDVPGAGSARVAISGASGLIGGALTAFLTTGGHRVDPLVRRAPRAGTTEIHWDPARGEIDAAGIEGVDAVVHLAGENIAAGRWTAARKEAIRASRVEGTRLLCRALAGLNRRPSVLVSASATGYYGDRGDEPLHEDSPPGSGFLADVCQAWEAATAPAAQAGIRVVILRNGLVLTGRGGALGRMLGPFRLGLGGVMGSGRQYMSWIALDDLVRAIQLAMLATTLAGPVNAVAPRPVTNAEFTQTLGRLLRRPTILALPGPLIRLAFGEMGPALLLASARVLPARLEAAGFQYRHAELADALREALGETRRDAA
ncbi:MAG: TIGR01777 family oxidoreductase [Candidatus Rokuibacteriota bacterium]